MYRSSFLGQGCRNVFRSDCLTPLSSKLSEAYRRKILLAPHHARYGRNDIVLERSCRSKFGNETLMQFLEVRPIFAREDSGRGVAAVFEGWMNLIYWSWHWDAHAQKLHRLHARESQIAVPVLFIPPFADISQGERPRPGYLNRRKLAHLGSSPPRGLGIPAKTHHWLSKRPRRSRRRPENFILRERNIASGARCLLAENCKIRLPS